MATLENMSVDELDQETIRLKTDQPAKMKDKLRAVKKVRDAKVHQERSRDRLRKLLNAMGHSMEDIDKMFEEKSDDELNSMVKSIEQFEDKIGVVVTPATAEVKAEGK